MAFRHDLLIGVRRGGILLAGMLAAVSVYRLFEPTPVRDDAPASSASPSTPSSPPPVEAVTPRPAPTFSTSGPPNVPPPPPKPGEGSAARVASRRAVSPQPSKPVSLEGIPHIPWRQSAAPVEEAAAPAAEARPPASPKETVATAEAAEPSEDVQDAQSGDATQRNRARKGWLKRVGKFLHIGGKDEAAPQGFRDKQ